MPLRLLAPPSSEEIGPSASADAYRLWLARVVALATSLGIVVLLLLAATAARSTAPHLLPLLLLDLLPLTSSLLALAYLLRVKPGTPYADGPVFVWLLSLWLYLLLDVVTVDGFQPPYGSSLMLLLLIAGLLLNGRRFRAFALTAIATLGIGMLLDLTGMLTNDGLHPDLLARFDPAVADRPGSSSLSSLSIWFGSILSLAVAAGLLYLYNRSINFSLSRSRRELLERRAAEHALRQSQQRYQNFIEHSFEGVWLIQFDQPIPTDLPPEVQVELIFTTGYIAEANQAQARFTGFANRTDLIGKRLSEIYPTDPDGSVPLDFTSNMLQLIASGYRQFESDTPFTNMLDVQRLFSISTIGVIIPGKVAGPDVLIGLWGSQRDITAPRLAQIALQRRNDQLTTLNHIAATLATFKDLNGVLMEVLSSLKNALLLDVFYVALFDEKSRRLRFPLVFDSEMYYATLEALEVPEWLVDVIDKRRPVRLNRTPDQIDIRRSAGPLYIGDRRRVSASLLAAPLQVGARLIGVISVQSYMLNAYDEQHLEFLALASQGVAAAIDNAALYENLQRELRERIKAETALQQLNVDLERRVERRTAELEAAVKELEAFSYSVSHDLRGPLRAIDGYSRFLIEDYADRLDGEGRLFLDNVRKAAQRMGLLIDDLLNLSRVSRLDLHLLVVDLSALVEDIAAVLRLRDPLRQVEIHIQPGLTALADPNLLRLALENLLDNAWKFTARAPHARIEFQRVDSGMSDANSSGGELQNDDGSIAPERRPSQIFCVRDNGAGFDMRYVDKLFKPFSRLHGVEEFEGTGIGLAGVKRIVERHGGVIWAEGTVGGGATFYLALPNSTEVPESETENAAVGPDLG